VATIYIFFGLIASGKSTLAAQFASGYNLPYVNTDRVRKDLAGINPTAKQADQLNQGIYTREFTRQTYQAMLDQAAEAIRAGQEGIVLDGSYASEKERSRVIGLAESLAVEYVFIQCVCSEGTVKQRLEARARDPQAVSDGRWEIYLVQREKFQPPAELENSRLITIDTEQPVDKLVETLAQILNLQ
jgi:predicted kinase